MLVNQRFKFLLYPEAEGEHVKNARMRLEIGSSLSEFDPMTSAGSLKDTEAKAGESFLPGGDILPLSTWRGHLC